MKMTSKTLRTIIGIFFLLIWIAFSVMILIEFRENASFISKLELITLFAIVLLVLYLMIYGIFTFKMECQESYNEAWEKVKNNFKGNVGKYKEVYYLFPEDTSNHKYNELAYRAKYKGYIFLAKIMDDNKIYLSCVDDKGNEIEHREIENPIFFNKHFSFTKKE